MELSREPFALSDLVGKPVYDGSGRRLGRAYEAIAHWERDGTIVIEGLLLGRRALLGRLRGPARSGRAIPWEAVVDIECDRILVRI